MLRLSDGEKILTIHLTRHDRDGRRDGHLTRTLNVLYSAKFCILTENDANYCRNMQ